MYYISTGKIIYDPKRYGLKKRTKWWCVINVDTEITRYYRWWIERKLHIKGLCQPSWDAHISVIRGEEPEEDLKYLWKKYDSEIVEFQYKHYPYQSGSFWFVEVLCPKAIEIRKELQRPTHWKLHLTVGRTWF